MKLTILSVILLLSNAFSLPFIKTFPISFHVITDNKLGNVSKKRLDKQIIQLNKVFSGRDNINIYLSGDSSIDSSIDSGIRFTLNSIDYTSNKEWYQSCSVSTVRSVMKKSLNIKNTINVYTCNCSLIWGLTDSDAIIVWHAMTPEGSSINYNKGDILAHEVGHYFGLLHPYQNGCTEPNDHIQDTPEMRSQLTGSCLKFKGLDSCPLAPGKDLLHNYMIAGIHDNCKNSFTPGQVLYMQNYINTHFIDYCPKIKNI